MRQLKQILFITILAVITLNKAKAQDYATVEYWGKSYNLDQSFFQYLNNNYTFFLNGNAQQWKYYDFKDYNAIYVEIVENLRKPSFTIIVTEANQLQWRNAIGTLPGTDGEKERSKKSHARATWVLTYVVLPSLRQFVTNYNQTHQFQN